MSKDNMFDFGNGPVPAHQHTNGMGWVANTAYVSDSAYVGPYASVFENAKVSDNSQVYGDAKVFGNAMVYGNAKIYGCAKVLGDSRVFDDARVCGCTRVSDWAQISLKAFEATGCYIQSFTCPFFRFTGTFFMSEVGTRLVKFLQFGCEVRPVSYWRKNLNSIVRKHIKDKGEIKIYKNFLSVMLEATT